jgi:hypothetical protein
MARRAFSISICQFAYSARARARLRIRAFETKIQPPASLTVKI